MNFKKTQRQLKFKDTNRPFTKQVRRITGLFDTRGSLWRLTLDDGTKYSGLIGSERLKIDSIEEVLTLVLY